MVGSPGAKCQIPWSPRSGTSHLQYLVFAFMHGSFSTVQYFGCQNNPEVTRRAPAERFARSWILSGRIISKKENQRSHARAIRRRQSALISCCRKDRKGESQEGEPNNSSRRTMMKHNPVSLSLLLAGCWLFSSFEGALGLLISPPPRSFRTRTTSSTFSRSSSLPTVRRTKRITGLCLSSSVQDGSEEYLEADVSQQRRRILLSPPTLLGLLSPLLLHPAPPSEARGLVQFPCPKLSNTYHFLRVGTTLLEEEGACGYLRGCATCDERAPAPIAGKRRNQRRNEL